MHAARASAADQSRSRPGTPTVLAAALTLVLDGRQVWFAGGCRVARLP